MTYQADSSENHCARGVIRAAIRLSQGDDPIDIGKYAFEPTAEKIAEILRNSSRKPPVLTLHYDREIVRQMIKAYSGERRGFSLLQSSEPG